VQLIASKYLYDDGEEEEVFNSEFAKCSNLPLLSVNHAEKHFLNAIEWEIFVDPHQFYKQLVHVEKLVMQAECKKRSFSSLTYSELRRFLNDRDLQIFSTQFTKRLLHSMILFSLAYTGLVLSVVLSTICVINVKQAANQVATVSQHTQTLNSTWNPFDTQNFAFINENDDLKHHQHLYDKTKFEAKQSESSWSDLLFIHHPHEINQISVQNWTQYFPELPKLTRFTHNLLKPFS
jgi:hypothetical protein